MRVLSIILLLICTSCTPTYKVIGIRKATENNQLNFIYIKDKKNKIYELVSVEIDTMLNDSRLISVGDNLKLRLKRKDDLRVNTYNSTQNSFDNDTIIENSKVDKTYYTSNLIGIYYIK